MCFCELCWSWDEPSSERVAPVQEDGPYGLRGQVELRRFHSPEIPETRADAIEADRRSLEPFSVTLRS